ncbi:MAG: hypothetical protein JJT94_10655 [Bernardetiaceae bacterium]|nr:hypothetical protein [Bernardetiaceae bacterium]
MKQESNFYVESLRLLLCLSFVFVAFGCQPENDKQAKQEPATEEIALEPAPEPSATPQETLENQNIETEISVTKPVKTKPTSDKARRPEPQAQGFAATLTDEDINNFILKKKEVQTFSIAMDESEQTISCKEGTRITIPPLAFVYADGSPVAAGTPVSVEVREYYKKSDIILCGLATHADNQILESGGMIYIEATAEGQKVQLAPSKNIEIAMPKQNTKVESEEGMQTFVSNNASHQPATNWQALQAQNTAASQRTKVKNPKARKGIYKKILNSEHSNAIVEDLKGGDQAYQCAIPAVALRYTRFETNFHYKKFKPLEKYYASKKPDHIETQLVSRIIGDTQDRYVRRVNGNPSLDSLIREYRQIDFDDSKMLSADAVETDTVQLLFTLDSRGEMRLLNSPNITESQAMQLLEYQFSAGQYSYKMEGRYAPMRGGRAIEFNKSPWVQNLMPMYFYQHIPYKTFQANYMSHLARGEGDASLLNQIFPNTSRTIRRLARRQRTGWGEILPYEGDAPSFVLTMVIDVQKQYWEARPKEALRETAYLLCYSKEAYTEILDNSLKEGKTAQVAQTLDYVITSSKLGWLNCDRFKKMPAALKTDLIVKAGSGESLRLIFKNINAVMSSYGGYNRFDNVPKRRQATLMAIKKENGRLFVGLEDIKISSVHTPNFDYKEINSLKELEQFIAHLN